MGPSLLYVARYNKAKGQLGFLRSVDPNALKGYTVRFFGADLGETNIDDAMREVAAQRGIDIEIHGPVAKHQLLKEYCAARGQIHFAISDRYVCASNYPVNATRKHALKFACHLQTQTML